MKELELKHIAPYLPYDINVIPNGSKQPTRILGIQLSPLNIVVVRYGEIRESKVGFKWFKPILKPLSEYPFEKLPISTDMLNNALYYGTLAVNHYNDMLSYHYDVFGLIDAGLAIDINTLKNG